MIDLNEDYIVSLLVGLESRLDDGVGDVIVTDSRHSTLYYVVLWLKIDMIVDSCLFADGAIV